MIIIQVIGAFVAVVSIAITFGVPKKFLIYSGIVGAIGWFIYLILAKTGLSSVTRMFVAALVVSLVSHSYARTKKAPVTLFLIAGILPLVPGVGMYQIVYSILINDTKQAAFYFSETMQIAGMIALAIFIMDTIFRNFQKN
jgi:uncharacterized membrane protein YjjB (DUF3815 family)